MCGIVGILSDRGPNAERALRVLKRLEYRGYDSAGLAVYQGETPAHYREVGKLAALEEAYAAEPKDGHVVIGHTRWATHGKPTRANAHPHRAGKISVVHNGIIENYEGLKAALFDQGAVFHSDTDTEVIAALMAQELEATDDPIAAFHATIDQLEGAYAIAMMIDGREDLLLGARHGSPMVLGLSPREHFLCSDALGLAGMMDEAVFLEDGDRVIIEGNGYYITDAAANRVSRTPVPHALAANEISKGEYSHFMQKEIHEQPALLQGVLSHCVDFNKGSVDIDLGSLDLAAVSQLVIIACGTSLYAAHVAKYWFEHMAHMPVRLEVASEFRHSSPQLIEGSLCVFISQSGETADTLSALKYAKELGFDTLGIVNVMGSSIAREATHAVDILAGPEIGVASTKAFTCQLLVLGLLALKAASLRGVMDADSLINHLTSLKSLPVHLRHVLAQSDGYKQVAKKIASAPYALYVGRGIMTPIAFEGALKLKEITYIPAEGYAAGELKHGPIALISDEVPVIGLVSENSMPGKTASNLSEIASRDGKIYLLTDQDETIPDAQAMLSLPKSDMISAPIIFTLPIQLLAYYCATHKGTDVDQPRNLAKSVTVE